MKKHSFLCLITILLMLLPLGASYAVGNDLYLVFDRADPETQIAKRFRSCPQLCASASGQFSADELPKILRSIPKTNQNIWIVDLRQESHGFIDGLPVSWVADQNAANIDKTAKEIEIAEKKLLQILAHQKAITVYALKKLAAGKVGVEKPKLMLPETVETEKQLVNGFDAKYARIYVLDHNKPNDAEVDSFVQFIKYQVKAEDWLHFHCRGGGGRSSTFMAMYDMIRNSNNLSCEQIIQRQAKLGSIKLDEMPTNTSKLWKCDKAHERYVFLCKFYEYVKDPNGYAVSTWSDWQKINHDKL